ncbi:MAG TPA: penicillin acylase family protein [Panacibacter sp.]|nr:penicillin acylase family protein [Panacibacter sp.]HNP43594.1 penicillin acylase family protein [Panacibacter sp.]
MKKAILLLFIPFHLSAQTASGEEVARWRAQADRVTIIRDNWGIPHIYGKSDADAVFGLLYAQCEDDFQRVEMNYIEKLGRKSEVFGEKELNNDLYVRLVIDSLQAMQDYSKSPQWLVKLMNAFADGVNYYLYTHPAVKPALLSKFQPWYPLLWTDGSIGAISTGDITENDAGSLYFGTTASLVSNKERGAERLTGSNGFALSPSRTISGNAILYINPHVTFYFRPEVQVTSEEGLDVYGAVTWGQFFVYQGFNENCGWMHTSSNVDVADMYAENITKKNSELFYEYDGQLKPVKQQAMSFRYKTGNGFDTKNITTYATGHGPVMAKRDGKLISVKANNQSLDGLIQCWLRTKATGFESFKKTMAIRANTSNNTVYADKDGNIAYWHGDFIPVRDTKYNWGKVVDGSNSATEWKGLHQLDDIVHVYNPSSGFIQNCNSTPFTVSGSSSPDKKHYPPYMAPDGENFRGINAARELNNKEHFDIDKMIRAGYTTYLPAFASLLPALLAKFESTVKPGDSLYNLLKEPIAVLKQWDFHTAEQSVATTLAVEWAERLNSVIRKVYIEEGETDQVDGTKNFVANASAEELLMPLAKAVNNLTDKFGTWNIAWGELNRFQRVKNDLQVSFDDTKTSYPVGFTSSQWGMLASFGSDYYGTQKRYGNGGNSFICAVEFGKKIKAKSLLAGGESGDPGSKHFSDQLEMYTHGQFKEVLFYREDVVKHAERTYHPGE